MPEVTIVEQCPERRDEQLQSLGEAMPSSWVL